MAYTTPITDAGENFPLAAAAGLGGALLGAALWAAFTVTTGIKLGAIAIAVGALIGFAIRAVPHAQTWHYRVLGAICGVIGWLFGTMASDLAGVARLQHADLLTVMIATPPSTVINLVIRLFTAMDIVFFGITVYEAAKFSVRR
jgi:hypothetical protein